LSFAHALKDSGGEAARQSQAKLEGLSGALKGLKSALEGLAIALAQSGLLEFLTNLTDKVTAIIRSFSKSNPKILKFTVILAGITAVIGPLVLGLGLMTTAMGALSVASLPLLKGFLAVSAVVATISAAFTHWDTIMEKARSVGRFFGFSFPDPATVVSQTIAKQTHTTTNIQVDSKIDLQVPEGTLDEQVKVMERAAEEAAQKSFDKEIRHLLNSSPTLE